MIACFCDKNGTSHIGTDYYLRVDGRLTRDNQIGFARQHRERFKKHFRHDYDDMTHVMFINRIRDLPDAYNGRPMPLRYPIVSPQITKGKPIMFAIFDDFNRKVISKHRTIQTAAKAKQKFVEQFRRNNSSHAYLPVVLTRLDSSGEVLPISDDDYGEFCRLLDRD